MMPGSGGTSTGTNGMEYRSKTTFLGLPLVHVALGTVVDGRHRRGVATAWLATGGLAIAREYAIGGLALAQHVIAGRGAGTPPFSSIPHAPFRWSDALVLFVIVVAL